LRFGPCLGAWLVFLGHWGDLGAFSRESARLQANELPHLPLQLLALKLYRLGRLGKNLQSFYISAISASFKVFFKKTCRVKTEKHAGGMPRHARHE
jgi:hypothetical protein